jgi:hypothetical protein
MAGKLLAGQAEIRSAQSGEIRVQQGDGRDERPEYRTQPEAPVSRADAIAIWRYGRT